MIIPIELEASVTARTAASSAPVQPFKVGELEVTPVTAAIARYLGVDLSSDGKAAQSRRGIALVVHGPARSGKSTLAGLLARRYGACVVRIDDVIKEAIARGATPTAARARELCVEAGHKYAEQQRELAAQLAAAAAENAPATPAHETSSGGTQYSNTHISNIDSSNSKCDSIQEISFLQPNFVVDFTTHN